ncbi:MAG: hypothetical protein E7531_03475 [Ruminococcaceae bacterium]|nr:hypothetical protein [Oscillospiraceae bacterium]
MTTKNPKEQIFPNTSIVKLTYKRQFFDISQMKTGAKKVITITADGTVVIKEYDPGSRKAYSVRKISWTVDAYRALCDKIESCIENADRLDFYVDDASEELKIFHKYGRVQIVDRGLGNEEVHIASIMHEFFNGLQK